MSSFVEGDEVLAKWPGSRTYYAAKVVSYDGDTLNVKFKEGGELANMKTTFVKHVSLKFCFNSV